MTWGTLVRFPTKWLETFPAPVEVGNGLKSQKKKLSFRTSHYDQPTGTKEYMPWARDSKRIYGNLRSSPKQINFARHAPRLPLQQRRPHAAGACMGYFRQFVASKIPSRSMKRLWPRWCSGSPRVSWSLLGSPCLVDDLMGKTTKEP